MLVLGALVALYGVANFTFTYVTPAEKLLEMHRSQMAAAGGEPQPFPVSVEAMRMAGMAISALMVIIGVTLMILAGPVRRASRGAAMGGAVVVGIVSAFLLLLTGIAAIAGLAAPPVLMVACCFSVPLALGLWLFLWLYQAVGAATALAQARGAGPGHPGPHGSPMGAPGNYPPFPGVPTQGTPWPPGSGATTPTTTPPPTTPTSFGPAPFGIPPPPGDTPAGKYGYATKPSPDKATGENAPPPPPNAE